MKIYQLIALFLTLCSGVRAVDYLEGKNLRRGLGDSKGKGKGGSKSKGKGGKFLARASFVQSFRHANEMSPLSSFV